MLAARKPWVEQTWFDPWHCGKYYIPKILSFHTTNRPQGSNFPMHSLDNQLINPFWWAKPRCHIIPSCRSTSYDYAWWPDPEKCCFYPNLSCCLPNDSVVLNWTSSRESTRRGFRRVKANRHWRQLFMPWRWDTMVRLSLVPQIILQWD